MAAGKNTNLLFLVSFWCLQLKWARANKIDQEKCVQHLYRTDGGHFFVHTQKNTSAGVSVFFFHAPSKNTVDAMFATKAMTTMMTIISLKIHEQRQHSALGDTQSNLQCHFIL